MTLFNVLVYIMNKCYGKCSLLFHVSLVPIRTRNKCIWKENFWKWHEKNLTVSFKRIIKSISTQEFPHFLFRDRSANQIALREELETPHTPDTKQLKPYQHWRHIPCGVLYLHQSSRCDVITPSSWRHHDITRDHVIFISDGFVFACEFQTIIWEKTFM